MKILTAAQLKKLSDGELDAVYAGAIETSNNDPDVEIRHKASRYILSIGRVRTPRLEAQLQKLKDDRLATLEKERAEVNKKRLKQLEKAASRASAKVEKLKADYKAKYGVEYVSK